MNAKGNRKASLEMNREMLSAMVDEELTTQENESIIEAMKDSPSLQQSWSIYHLIQEVLQAQQNEHEQASAVTASFEKEALVHAEVKTKKVKKNCSSN